MWSTVNKWSFHLLMLAAVSSGCLVSADGGSDGQHGSDTSSATVRLEAAPSGDVAYCPPGADTCHTYSNPDSCAAIVITIDNEAASTCETCEDDEGNVRHRRCEDTQVACEMVTAPEPDCIVCAYVGGQVIHTTCVVSPEDSGGNSSGGSEDAGAGTSCETVTMESHPPIDCKVCYDDAGTVASRECEARCERVECAQLACPSNARQWTPEGACCPVCEPTQDCAAVDCAPSGPTCLPGTRAVLLANDCCQYSCEPVESPVCQSSADCRTSQICSTQRGVCDTNPACASDPDAGCDASCYGTCIDPDPDEGDTCDVAQCGPAPAMPNYSCPDGTVAGPGPCKPNADGICGWTLITCPEAEPAGLEERLTETAQCGFVEVWATDRTDSVWLRLRFEGADGLELGVWTSYDFDLPSDALDIRLQTGSNLTINACTDAISHPGPSVVAEYRPISGRASLRVVRESSTAAWPGSHIVLNSGHVEIVLDEVVFSNGQETVTLGSLVLERVAVYDVIQG